MVDSELDRGPKRDAILDAAHRRFSHFGYARTTLDDIAAEADVPRHVLTTFVRDRDDAFRAVAQREHDQALTTARSAMAGSLPDALRSALRARVELEVPAAGRQFRSDEMLDPDGEISGEISRAFTRDYLAVLADIFAAGDERGEIALAAHQISAADAAELVHCAARGIATNHVDRATTHRRIEQFVTLLIAGLRPAPAASRHARVWADTSRV